MEKKILFTLLAVVLLAGCAAPETIHFSDEAQIARLEQNAMPAPPAGEGLGKAEVRQIETAVFIWLLQHPITADSANSAIFLQTDEATTTALMKEFPAHVPPLKQSWHLETRPGQSPLDRDTGRSAMILKVDVAEPENGSVEAVGKWFAGDMTAGFHTFELKKSGDGWQIQAVK